MTGEEFEQQLDSHLKGESMEILRALKRSDDPILVVLRFHLHIERMMERVI